MNIIPVPMFLYHMSQSQKRASDAQKLELKVVVSHHMGAKGQIWVLWKSGWCF